MKINGFKLKVDMSFPKGKLSQFIDSFWLFENNDNEPINYTIIPDGFFKLIVIYVNENLSKVKLVGLFDRPINISTPANSVTFLIKFKLLASEYLLNSDIGSLLNSSEELKFDFWDIDQFKIGNIEEYINFVKKSFNDYTISVNNIPEKKKQLSSLIYSTYSTDNVTQITDKIDWSHRQINRYLKKHIGVSIKEYLNILKCAEAYDQISEGELFPNENYSDQSHFSKSVKKQTGTTPKKLYEKKNDQFIQLQLTKKK